MMNIDMILKRFMQRDLSGFFVTSIVFVSLLSVYSLACSILLPHGVNAFFTSVLWKILCGTLALFVVLFAGWKLLTRKMSYSYKREPEKFQPHDFILLLIPMTPVAQYIISNQNSLTVAGSILIFLFFTAVSALSGVVVPVLLSRFAPKRILITAAVGFVTMVMGMAYLSVANEWVGKGIMPVQMAVLAGIILVLSLRKFMPEKIINIAIVSFFAVNTVTGFITSEPSEGMSENLKNLPLMQVMEGKTIKRHNDIMLLVYEGYTADETLKYYGYDNSEQAAFLKANGFYVYNGAYSIGVPTEQSLTKVFNVNRDIPEHKKYLAGGGAVHALLKQQGYKTSGVFDNNWNFRGLAIEQIKYDLAFPRPTGVMDAKVLINAILTGEFSDAVSFEGVEFESYLKYKRNVIAGGAARPVFMYSHSQYPGHGPSGKGMSLDQREEKVKAYLEGIAKANNEMRQDVETVVRKNPDAIVVLAGDHGPFLTKTGYGLSKGRGNFKEADIDRYDVQDRFGAFLAIRWPEKDYAKKHDIKIFQDIFPAIFSYLYGDDTLFDRTRVERTTKENFRTLGVYVKDGIIHGGRDDGKPLFLMER